MFSGRLHAGACNATRALLHASYTPPPGDPRARAHVSGHAFMRTYPAAQSRLSARTVRAGIMRMRGAELSETAGGGGLSPPLRTVSPRTLAFWGESGLR